MSVTIHLPNVLVPLADGHRTLDARGDTLKEAIDDVVGRYPRLAARLRDEHGRPYEYVTFYLNDADIRLNGGFEIPVRDGDEVTVVPAVAGG
jgi:molybdopterin converting factor small subunit